MGIHTRVSPLGAGYGSFDTTTDLAAWDLSTLAPGTPAFVAASGGSVWLAYPTGTAVPAGVVTVAAVNGVWVYAGPAKMTSYVPMNGDPTGVLSSNAAFAAAATIASTLGLPLAILPGTYRFDAQVDLSLYPGLRVEQSPRATIVADLDAPVTVQAGTLFYAPLPAIAASTTMTVNAPAGLGNRTITTAAALTPGTWVVVTGAVHAFSAVYYVESVLGLVATLDRAVLYPFTIGDFAQTLASAPVTGVQWHGGTGSMTGKCVGFLGGTFWHSSIDGLNIHGITGTHADYGAGLFGGSYDSVLGGYLDATGAVNAFNAGYCNFGDGCTLDHARAVSATTNTGSAIKLSDARAGWVDDCSSDGFSEGLLLGSDFGSTVGVAYMQINGGTFLNATDRGVYVGAGSTHNEFTGAIYASGTAGGVIIDNVAAADCNTFDTLDLSGTPGFGIYIMAGGARDTKIGSLVLSDVGNYGADVRGSCWIGLLRARMTISQRLLMAQGGPGNDCYINQVDIVDGGSGNQFILQATAASRLVVGGGTMTLAANDIGLSANGAGAGVVCGAVTITGVGSSLGFFSNGAGATLQAGAGSDASGCGSPFTAASGGLITAGQQAGTYTSTATTGTDTMPIGPTGAFRSGISSAASLGGDVVINAPAGIPGLAYDVYCGATLNGHAWKIGVTGGTAITVAAGKRCRVMSDGTNMQRVTPDT